MLPANQRLRARQLRRVHLNIILRLIQYPELPLIHCRLQIIEKPLFQHLLHPQVLIIDHQGILIIPADHIAGRPGLVKQDLRVHFFLPRPDPHAQTDIDTV